METITVEKPDGGAIGAPPKDLGQAAVMLCSKPDLNGNDSTLVIDTHEDSEKDVEANPASKKISSCGAGFGEMDGCEEEGYRGEKEARFLVWDEGEKESG